MNDPQYPPTGRWQVRKGACRTEIGDNHPWKIIDPSGKVRASGTDHAVVLRWADRVARGGDIMEIDLPDGKGGWTRHGPPKRDEAPTPLSLLQRLAVWLRLP